MPTVIHQLADAFLERKRELAEKRKAKSVLPQSDYFMPKSSKEDMETQQRLLEEQGLPGVIKEGAKKMYENPVVNTAIGFSPGAGDIQSGYEAYRSAREGNYGEAGLNALGVLPFVPALSGMVIGKSSKTWDAIQAAEAAKRLEAGEDAAKVYKETGYKVAPWDKQMRSEISDVPATINPATDVIHGYGVSNDKSVTAEKRLKEAYELQKEGFSPEKIYKITGYKQTENGLEDLYVSPYATVVEHKELAQNYPSLENLKTEIAQQRSDIGGYYDPNKDLIRLYAAGEDWNKLPNTKSDMLHELTHAIQTREGFARGGSTTDIKNEVADAYEKIGQVNQQMDMLVRSMDSAKAAGNMEKYNMYKQMYEDAMDYKLGELVPIANQDPYQSYRRLAGEAEARLVQARAHMTPEELRAQYPYEPAYFQQVTGVPLSELITKFDESNIVNRPTKAK